MRAINLLALLSFSVASLAQELPYNPSQKVKLEPGVQQLDVFLKQLSKKARITFSFDTKKINASKSVAWTLQEGTLKEVLAELSKLINIEAVEVDNHIVLISRPKPQKTAQPKNLKKHDLPQLSAEKTDAGENETLKKSPRITPTSLTPINAHQSNSKSMSASLPANDDNDTLEIKTVTADSSVLPPLDPSPKTETTLIDQPQVPKKNEIKIDSIEKSIIPSIIKNSTTPDSPKTVKEKKNIRFFIKGGITANEIMYSNATLQVGLPEVYGTFSAGTNFNLTELRFGGGTSIRLSDSWRLNLQVDFGKTIRNFKDFETDSSGAPINSADAKRIKVNGKATRINILFERKLSKNLSLQLGPTFTMMKTEYFVNNRATKAGSLGTDADKKYRTVSPPFLISNSFNANSTSNSKIWVGVQVGLFYTIRVGK
jgi:hypothetical protein